ncbi:MAG: DUF1329 domain-containing protein [Myxococcota bacterium]
MTLRNLSLLVSVLALAATLASPGLAAEDVAPGAPTFKPGDVITLDKVEKLKPFLPPEFWDNRDFFFYEGMQLEIGPSFADYGPPPVYTEATKKYSGQVKLGPESSLENYRAGEPFPMEAIDCKGDPKAGAKVAWTFVNRWEGFGWGRASFYYSYWDRGEELPLYYEGTSGGSGLAFRPEPEYEDSDGDVFRGEKRYIAQGPSVDAPFDARGIMLLTYRYKSSFGPKATAKNDDTWVYVPSLRRVRRISSAQRTDAVAGTEFTMDDLFSFNGVVPHYEWTCLGEMDLIAPMNSKIQAYPYDKDHNFGPFGLSFADDRWELRHALKFRFTPLNPDHPYKHKDIYIDKNSLEPLYSFAYDRKGELWKLLWHNHRWTGDPAYAKVYEGWKSVPEPRDNTVVADIIVNAQTGTGNRIEFWDRTLSPMDPGKIRRFIDVGRLTKGR